MNTSGGVSPNNRFNHKLCPCALDRIKQILPPDIALSAHQGQLFDASHGHNAGDISSGSLSESRFDRLKSHQVPPSSCSCLSPPYPLRRVFAKIVGEMPIVVDRPLWLKPADGELPYSTLSSRWLLRLKKVRFTTCYCPWLDLRRATGLFVSEVDRCYERLSMKMSLHVRRFCIINPVINTHTTVYINSIRH